MAILGMYNWGVEPCQVECKGVDNYGSIFNPPNFSRELDTQPYNVFWTQIFIITLSNSVAENFEYILKIFNWFGSNRQCPHFLTHNLTDYAKGVIAVYLN